MKFRIVPYARQYETDMAALFVRVFDEPGYEWDQKTALAYLNRNASVSPEYCRVAVNPEGVCMGGIFCTVHPYYKRKFLFIDALQIHEDARNLGIAKALMKHVVTKAKRDGIAGIRFLADSRLRFPKEWYERIGFKKNSWIEYEAFLKDLRI